MSAELRATLRDLLADTRPDVVVLSFQELAPNVDIQPIAKITLKRSAPE